MADNSDWNPEEDGDSVQEAPDAHEQETGQQQQQQQQQYGGDSFGPDSPYQPTSATADNDEEAAHLPTEPAADYDQPPASPGHSDDGDGNEDDDDNDDDADHPASPDNPVEYENPVQTGDYEEDNEDRPASPTGNDEENNPASPPASPTNDGAETAEDPTATSLRGYSEEAEPTTLSEDPAGRREEEETDTAAVEEEQDADNNDDDMQISDAEDSALVPTAAAAVADVVESVSEPLAEEETDVVEQQVEVVEEVVAAEEEVPVEEEEVPVGEEEVPDGEDFQSSSRKRRRLSSSTPADDAEGGGEEARAVAAAAAADDSDAESDFEGFEPPEAKHPRRRQLLDDDDDDIEGQSQSQSEQQQQQAGSGGIIADIFGESDQEDEGADVGEVSGKAGEEEFEGFNAAEAEAAAGGGDGGSDDDDSSSSSSSGDEGGAKNDEEEGQAPGFPVSDFDAIMAQKKNERRQSRKRSSARGGELLTDADSVITQVVYEMLEAAQSDKELMKSSRPATKKMKMLPKVVSLLTKADVLANLSESAMLSAITEWLAPCPDGSLPSLQIRDTLLRMLETIPGIDADGLATSGLGKAVMYLYKHRRETRANKAVCGRLINAWSRPIFELTTNYSTLTKEEREERDYANIPQHKRSSAGEQRPAMGRSDSTGGSGGPSGSGGSRPKLGDPGYVARARVPLPSNKDYVVRPKPKVDVDAKMASAPPKKKERQVWFERHVRQLSDKKRSSKVNKKAMPISIEGRKMAL